MQELLTASERRRGWWIIGLFVALVVGSWFFPNSPLDGIIWCPIRRITGLECPGCGMTRACVMFVRGNFLDSLGYHLFGPAMMVGLGIAAGQSFVQIVRGRRVDWWGSRTWHRHQHVFWRVLLGVLLLYSVARLLL